jgi:hypothetical protein
MSHRKALHSSVIVSATLFTAAALLFVTLDGSTSQTPSVRVGERKARKAISFEDVTRSSSIPAERTPTWGSTWIDHDRDGAVELLLNRHMRRAYLFENLAGRHSARYEPAFEQPAPGRKYYDRHACAWGEANGDGMPDLYCVAGAQKGRGIGPNQLLIQTPSGLVDRAGSLGLTDPTGRGRTVNWIDFDTDGDLDIFVGNERRSGSPNVVFRNDDGAFTRVHVGVGDEIATSNSTWADWDNDGDPDLMVFAHGTQGAQVFRNEGGTFVRIDVPSVSGQKWDSGAWADYDGDGWIDLHLVSRWRSLVLRNVRGTFRSAHSLELVSGRMSTWLDVENDGDLDLFIVEGAPKPRWRYQGNHEDILLVQERGVFERLVSAQLRGPKDGSGDSVAAADYDGDGATDLFITNGYLSEKGQPQLMRNTSKVMNWTGVMLDGGAKNPFGFGARVELDSASLSYSRATTDGFNFKVQAGAGYVHLGLGFDLSAAVRVTWRDGTQDCVVVANAVVARVTKGRSPCLP